MKTGGTMKLVWVGFAVAVTLTLASGAYAQPGEFVKGVLQPLADGFPKRAITLVNSDEAGSRNGIMARELQNCLKPFSPVDIIVSDEKAPANASWYSLKDTLRREGGADGYYPIIWSVFGGTTELLTDPVTKDTGMTLSDVKMVITLDGMVDVLIQRKNAPWGPTFAGFVKYGKEHPGELRYISREVGSGNDIRSESLIRILGLKVKKIPQGTNQEVASAIGAGQGDFTLTIPSTALPNWETGRVDVTMVTGNSVPPPWDKDPNIVSSKAAGLPELLEGNISGFAVPSKVPQAHIDWLFKLLKAGASTDKYKNYQKTLPGVRVYMLNPQESDALNKKIIELTDPVIRSIGLHIDQQKK